MRKGSVGVGVGELRSGCDLLGFVGSEGQYDGPAGEDGLGDAEDLVDGVSAMEFRGGPG